MRHHPVSRFRSGWRGLAVLLGLLVSTAATYLQAGEPGQPPDASQVVKSLITSLERMRSKPLRIQFERPKMLSTLLVDGQSVWLEQRGGDANRPSHYSQTCIVDNHWLMAVRDERGQLRLYSCLVLPDDRYVRTFARTGGADFFGFAAVIWRNKCHDLVDVLRAIHFAGRRDTIDGADVDVLEGSSEDVAIKLWIDRSSGYALRKIEYRPSVPDKLTEENIGRIPGYSLYTAEFSELEKTEAGHLPRKIRVHGVTVPCVVQAGKVLPCESLDRRFDLTCKYEVLKKTSKDDFKITMEIPEGTPVRMEDARQVDFVWRGGTILQKTP